MCQGHIFCCLSSLECCRCHAVVQTQAQRGNAEASRWPLVAAALYNTHRYYSQFQGTVQKAISDSLAELEKQLEASIQILCESATRTWQQALGNKYLATSNWQQAPGTTDLKLLKGREQRKADHQCCARLAVSCHMQSDAY